MSVTELKTLTDEFQKSWKSFKDENDKLIKETTGLNTEKVEKLGNQMDAVEAKFKKLELQAKEDKQLSEKEKAIEAYKSAPETAYLLKGVDGLNAEQKAKLIAGDATNGGYLVRPEFDNEIIKKVTEIDPISQYAKVIQGSGRSLIYPKRNTLLTGYWVGEQGDVVNDASTYGQGEIMTHAIAVDVPVSQELLQDAFVNVETEIGMDAAEGFAQKEGEAFLLGNNVTQPEGILTNAGVTTLETESSLVINGDDLYNLMFSLKSAYVRGANWFGNRLVLRTIRKLKDTQNRYLLETGQTAGISYVLLGTNWVETPSMSTLVTTAGSKVLMYGDMYRAYCIYNRIGMTVLRDPYTAKKQRMVEFQFEKRCGGAVKLPEALKVLKIKA